MGEKVIENGNGGSRRGVDASLAGRILKLRPQPLPEFQHGGIGEESCRPLRITATPDFASDREIAERGSGKHPCNTECEIVLLPGSRSGDRECFVRRERR